jgi:tetratricopeptide (TPR) repeat protein
MSAQELRQAEPELPRELPDNDRSLLALARMLRYANGGFALAFAVCNAPATRASLVATLRNALDALRIRVFEVTLTPDGPGVFEALNAAPGRPEPLFVYGLEHLLPTRDSERQHDTLVELNLRRERYRRLGRPLVFWLPDYAYQIVGRRATDFWSWHSAVFFFRTPEPERQAALERDVFGVDFAGELNLTLAEKQARLRLLRGLLDDYVDEDEASLRARSSVLWKLGLLHQALGNYAEAERLYRQSLEIKEALGDRRGVAVTLHNLSLLREKQGDLAQALQLYRRSRDLFAELGLDKDVSEEEEAIARVEQMALST